MMAPFLFPGWPGPVGSRRLRGLPRPALPSLPLPIRHPMGPGEPAQGNPLTGLQPGVPAQSQGNPFAGFQPLAPAQGESFADFQLGASAQGNPFTSLQSGEPTQAQGTPLAGLPFGAPAQSQGNPFAGFQPLVPAQGDSFADYQTGVRTPSTPSGPLAGLQAYGVPITYTPGGQIMVQAGTAQSFQMPPAIPGMPAMPGPPDGLFTGNSSGGGLLQPIAPVAPFNPGNQVSQFQGQRSPGAAG